MRPGAARSPRAKPACAGSRRIGSISTCCTGAGSTPLDETLEAFDALVRGGKIRHWGVSNFDVADMEELEAATHGRRAAAEPGALQPDATRHRVGRCCPGASRAASRSWPTRRSSRGGCSAAGRCERVAARHDATPAQVALAWVLRQDGVIAIPKAGFDRPRPRKPPRARHPFDEGRPRRARRGLPAADQAGAARHALTRGQRRTQSAQRNPIRPLVVRGL